MLHFSRKNYIYGPMRKDLPLKICILIVSLLMLPLSWTMGASEVDFENEWTAIEFSANDDTESEKKVQIWPNPASDVLNVKAKEDFKVVELLNMAGQVEKKEEVKAKKEISISVSDSPRGLYLLRIIPVSGKHIISKVILK